MRWTKKVETGVSTWRRGEWLIAQDVNSGEGWDFTLWRVMGGEERQAPGNWQTLGAAKQAAKREPEVVDAKALLRELNTAALNRRIIRLSAVLDAPVDEGLLVGSIEDLASELGCDATPPALNAALMFACESDVLLENDLLLFDAGKPWSRTEVLRWPVSILEVLERLDADCTSSREAANPE